MCRSRGRGGGVYRRRGGAAGPLLGAPPLLVLDEPTAGLDPNQIRQVRDLIRELSREKTVLLSTHILPEVEAICGRVLIIDRGRLVSSGKPEELRSQGSGVRSISLEAKAPEEALRAALASVSELKAPAAIERVGTDGVFRARVEVNAADLDRIAELLFRSVAAAGLALRELKREDTSLEDVFTRLTTREHEEPSAAGDAAASSNPSSTPDSTKEAS